MRDLRYRKKIARAFSEAVMCVTVHYGGGSDGFNDKYLNGKCKRDFSDVIIATDDGSILFGEGKGWVEEKIDGDRMKMWFKVGGAKLPADIYLYYSSIDRR